MKLLCIVLGAPMVIFFVIKEKLVVTMTSFQSFNILKLAIVKILFKIINYCFFALVSEVKVIYYPMRFSIIKELISIYKA